MGRARARRGGPGARPGGVGDRPRALPGAWPHARAPRGAGGPFAVRHHRRGARSDRQLAPARSRCRRVRPCTCRSRPGVAGSRADAEALAQRYHRAGGDRARVRAGRPRTPRSGLRHLGVSNDEAVLFERLASRALYADASLRASPAERAQNTLGQAGAVALRHLGRSAHRPRARGGRRRHAAGPAGAAGAGVLAPEGAARRHRDLERASDQLPRRDAGAAGHAPRQRTLVELEAPTRRLFSPAWRRDERGRSRLARVGGLGRAQRRAGRARPAAGPPITTRARASGAAHEQVGVDARARAHGPGAHPAAHPGQRLRRLWRRRARIRHRARGRDRDAAAVGQRPREPALRHGHHRGGRRLQLGHQQPKRIA